MVRHIAARLTVLLVAVLTLIAVYQFTRPQQTVGAGTDVPRVVVAPADQAKLARVGGAAPIYHVPDATELRATTLSEARLINFLLTVATGEFTCDGKPDCRVEKDFPEVVRGIVDRCHRVDTAALRRADPVLLGGIAADWDAACGPLMSAASSEGQPKDTPAWQQRVAEAKKIFGRVLGGGNN